jgi:hypothetical protein
MVGADQVKTDLDDGRGARGGQDPAVLDVER